jgi:hypothetical protein
MTNEFAIHTHLFIGKAHKFLMIIIDTFHKLKAQSALIKLPSIG